MLRDKAESDVELKYFHNLIGKSAEGVKLDAHPSAVTHSAID